MSDSIRHPEIPSVLIKYPAASSGVSSSPLEHGATVVMHSLTKWLGGRGTGIGELVVDRAALDWSDPKFRLYNEPDAFYHGIRHARDLGDLNPLAFILRIGRKGIVSFLNFSHWKVRAQLLMRGYAPVTKQLPYSDTTRRTFVSSH